MAHELEITADGAASFAFSGKIGSAWHRLGVEMDDLTTVEEILAACRGDYEVSRNRLYAVDPLGSDVEIDTGKSMTWRDRFIYDEDGMVTGSERQVLGIVGNDYKVIQNEDALRLALELAGMAPDRPNIDCAGVLDEGRRFFVTIPLPDLVVDPNGIADRYGRNLVVTTGHTGSHALELVNSYTRAVCANTVGAALRNSTMKVKVRHVGSDPLGVAEAKKTLGLVLSADEEFTLIAQNMLGIDADQSFVERVVDKLWPLADGANERQRHNSESRKEEILGIYNGPRCAKTVGENRYSVFQAVTEWMEHDQHIVGKSNKYNRAYRATQSNGFGKRVNALASLMQMDSPLKSGAWAKVSA